MNMNTTPEGFVEVPGFDGVYASRDGRIYVSEKRFRRSTDRKFRVHAARIAKPYLNRDGYQVLNVWRNGARTQAFAHVLIALAHVPRPASAEKLQVDHINRVRHDNRAENLRWVTIRENIMNGTTERNNSSGRRGVRYMSKTGRWVARITLYGKLVHLGSRATKEEAIALRESAEAQFWKDLQPSCNLP